MILNLPEECEYDLKKRQGLFRINAGMAGSIIQNPRGSLTNITAKGYVLISVLDFGSNGWK